MHLSVERQPLAWFKPSGWNARGTNLNTYSDASLSIVDRRAKAVLHRDIAKRLIEEWNVDAVQGRYSHSGHWYAKLARFPAALFDTNGYIRFPTEKEFLTSPHLRIGKQISVRQPGISAIPGYVTMISNDEPPDLDVHIDLATATEGQRRWVLHRQRERNRAVVNKKKKRAASLNCEVCGFSFGLVYGADAQDYCEVHHLLPLSEVKDTTQTRMADLAILCANCHRVVHLVNPPYTLDQVTSSARGSETVAIGGGTRKRRP